MCAASDSGMSVVIRILMVLLAFAVLVPLGCGQASSPTDGQERRAGVKRGKPASQPQPAPEPTTSSAGGTTVGEAFAEAELRPVGDSEVSGAVVFKRVGSLGVQVELSASGLPDPGEVYVAQVHKGSCSEVPRGADQEHEEDHSDEHGGGGPPLAIIRLERLLSGGREEYADHLEYDEPPAHEFPGNIDSPLSMIASNDGTGAVTSLMEGVKPEQLSSGVPKYLDLRTPNEEAPERWPALACADLGDGD